ncbi:protein DGCR14 [Platysternon megacephalum]|uniref:Protein DGCR14 n=1 Tax=Platysternon megacephalum TaxID=55544 RepID=A0A4D9F4G1_9SAUR|nr:protein DGCR14 [Platysternon megacephalum]
MNCEGDQRMFINHSCSTLTTALTQGQELQSYAFVDINGTVWVQTLHAHPSQTQHLDRANRDFQQVISNVTSSPPSTPKSKSINTRAPQPKEAFKAERVLKSVNVFCKPGICSCQMTASC